MDKALEVWGLKYVSHFAVRNPSSDPLQLQLGPMAKRADATLPGFRAVRPDS